MEKHQLTLVNPQEFGRPSGFAHGVLAPSGGRLLFVGGQIGSVAGARVQTDDLLEQFDLALANVLTVVRAAGGHAEQIARMTIYVTSISLYHDKRPALRQVWQRHMGSYYPAVALVQVLGLVDERAMVEIEATAVVP
jgi:enamine deaminase RidA (YjgF/YER057c/UK114 family)